MDDEKKLIEAVCSGYERAGAAGIGIPDEVPIYAQICERLPMELGVPAKTLFNDPEQLIWGTYRVCSKYGIDVPSVDFDTYNIEAEAVGQTLIYHDDIMPDVDRSKLLLASKDQLGRLSTPDFDKAGRCPFVVELYRMIKTITDLDVSLAFCAPFTLAANLRGIEPLIMDTFQDRGFVKDLFDFIVDDLLIPWLRYLCDKFPDTPMAIGADALSSLPIVNLGIFEEWVVPPIERIRDALDRPVIVPNQTGERFVKDPIQLMELRRRSNPLYIQGQDPDIEKLGPGFYKQYAQKLNLPLLLGIGAVFLNQATPEEIEERTRYYVETGGKDGRFWFYLCNLSPSTPEENIHAAVKTAKSIQFATTNSI